MMFPFPAYSFVVPDLHQKLKFFAIGIEGISRAAIKLIEINSSITHGISSFELYAETHYLINGKFIPKSFSRLNNLEF